MRNILLVLFILIISAAQTFAYAIKVYDQWGNRIGTYRKEGDNFVLYDFNDKKVENPEELIQNPPTQQTLTNYARFFYYDPTMQIGDHMMGLGRNTFRFYPNGRFIPKYFYQNHNRGIVCPTANKNSVLYEEKYPYSRQSKKNINIIQTGF